MLLCIIDVGQGAPTGDVPGLTLPLGFAPYLSIRVITMGD